MPQRAKNLPQLRQQSFENNYFARLVPGYLKVSLEPLEQRQLLAGNTVFVDNSWIQDTTNAAIPGTLQFGDPVISAGNTAGHNGILGTYGIDAFGTVTNTGASSLPGSALISDAIQNGATAGDTVSILEGTYTESDIVVNKSLLLSGAGTSGSLNTLIVPEATSSHSDLTNFGVGTHSGVIIYAASTTVQNLHLNGNGNGSLGGSANYHQGITTLYDTQNGGAYSSLHNGAISPIQLGNVPDPGGRPNRSEGLILIQNNVVDNVFWHGITLSANAGQQYGMSGTNAQNQVVNCTVNNVGLAGTQGYDQVGILVMNLDNYPDSSPSLGAVPAGSIFQCTINNAGVGAATRFFGTYDQNNGARIKGGIDFNTINNAVAIGIEYAWNDGSAHCKVNTINFPASNNAIGLQIENNDTIRYSNITINNAMTGIKIINSAFSGLEGVPLLGGSTVVTGPGTGVAGSIGVLLTNSAGKPRADAVLGLDLAVSGYATGVKAEQPFALPFLSGSIAGMAANQTASGTISTMTGGNNPVDPDSNFTVTTAAAHGLVNGQRVTLSGVGGVAGANGTFDITVTAANVFVLNGSNDHGNTTGYVAASGSWKLLAPIRVTTSAAHGLATNDRIGIAGVNGTVEANGEWAVTVVDATHFDLNGSTFVDAYTSGGTWQNPPQAHLLLDRPIISGNKVGFDISGNYLVEGAMNSTDPVNDPGTTFQPGYGSLFAAFYNSITNQQTPYPPATTVRLQSAVAEGITGTPSTVDTINTGNFKLNSTSTLRSFINGNPLTPVTIKDFSGTLFYPLTSETNPFRTGFTATGSLGTWFGNVSQAGGSLTVFPGGTELGGVYDISNAGSPIDARGMQRLEVVAKAVSGNQAAEFFIVFGDVDGTSYGYNFPFSALNTVTYTTLSLNIMPVGVSLQTGQAGMNLSRIASWSVFGNLGEDDMDGSEAFGINLDNIALTSPDSNSRINVTGTVSLNGATLGTVLNNNFVPTVGQKFTLIDNDSTDAVSGTFAGQPEGSTVSVGATKFTISYVGNGPSGNSNDVVLTRINAAVTVANTKLWYKGSTRFNVTNNNLPGFSDDNAIAPDKTAYLPTAPTAATFAAVSSYSRGINGLMVDLTTGHGSITVNDFTFKVGNNNSPSTWAAATAPTTVSTRAGAGLGLTDRVELMWANNAIQKQWLEVIVEGNDAAGGFNTNTGLASSYVFYFGNALGDAGVSDPTTFLVSGADEQSARNNPKSTLGTPALITDVNDFNRDGNVNTTDQQIPRNNTTNAITTALKFLTVAAAGPFAPDAGGGSGAGDSGVASGLAATSSTSSSSSGSGSGGWVNQRLESLASSASSSSSASAVADAVLGDDGDSDDDDDSLGDLLAGL